MAPGLGKTPQQPDGLGNLQNAGTQLLIFDKFEGDTLSSDSHHSPLQDRCWLAVYRGSQLQQHLIARCRRRHEISMDKSTAVTEIPCGPNNGFPVWSRYPNLQGKLKAFVLTQLSHRQMLRRGKVDNIWT